MLGMTPFRPRLDLDGTWAFELDPHDRGERDKWHAPAHRLSAEIEVPGCWQYRGHGRRSGQLRHDYQGIAWYQKKVAIPREWDGKSVFLWIGRALRRTTAFLNGVKIGNADTLLAPFEFNCTQACKPHAENVITLRIDNAFRSGTVYDGRVAQSDQEGDPSEPVGSFNGVGNWGGICDSVVLEARPQTRISGVHIFPDIDSESVTIAADVIREPGSSAVDALIGVDIVSREGEVVARSSESIRVAGGKESHIRVEMSLPGSQLWSPEDPYLYGAGFTLTVDQEVADGLCVSFGMRKVHAEKGKLYLNNRPYLLRGYSIGRGDPVLGTQPWLKETLLEQFKKARKMGFNHVRYHSAAPVAVAFEAADEVGVLIQAELPVVFAQYLLPNREFLCKELERLLLAYRNHPSLLSLSMGNEFNVDRDFKSDAEKRDFFYGAHPADRIHFTTGRDLRLGDFREVLTDVPDGSIDVILTDPPYPAKFLPLWTDLALFAKRTLKPTGILVAMSGQANLPEVMVRLSEHLVYRWVIAYLLPGSQAIVHARRILNAWKPVLVYGSLERRLFDVARSDREDKQHHDWGQSESGMADLLRLVADPGTRICDPFLGGGTTALVSIAASCSFIGAEIDPETYAVASQRLATT